MGWNWRKGKIYSSGSLHLSKLKIEAHFQSKTHEIRGTVFARR